MLDRHFAVWPKHLPHSLTLPETTLYHNLEVSAARYPNKRIIAFYGRDIPFRELKDHVDRLAGYLQRRLGVQRGDRVLLDMQNSPQFIIAYYAILRADAIIVPVNPMNVTNELRFFAQDSQAHVALIGQELYDRFAPLLAAGTLTSLVVAAYSDMAGQPEGYTAPDVVRAPRVGIAAPGVTLWADALAADEQPDPMRNGPDDLVVLPYTSGTTGLPKGCMHTHRSVQANVVGGVTWSSATSSACVLAALPLFHVTGMQGSMNAPIYVGGGVVLLTRWDREAAAELIQRYRCTGWTNISTMMVDFLANPRIDEYDLSSLTGIGGGGAPLPSAVGQRLLDMTGLRYVEGYGLSETIAQTHVNPSDAPKFQCLGIPVFDVDARIVDPATLRQLGPNEHGEIIVSGPQVFQGYWNQPEETAKVFVELDGKRFFRTGDLGYVDDDGYFFMVDRIKRMINASGFKVWPTEVETILYRHPAVQEACVVGVPDPRRGESVKAFIILRDAYKGQTSAEDIIEWAKGEMAAYKYPRQIEFVDTLPKTGSGKILWRELQEKERQKATVTQG